MKPQPATTTLVKKWSLSWQMRLQFNNEALVDNYGFSSKIEALVGNYGFSSKMKHQLPIEVLIKMVNKKKYFFMTWRLCGTKEANLNVSFIKRLDPIYIYFLINVSFWPKTQVESVVFSRQWRVQHVEHWPALTTHKISEISKRSSKFQHKYDKI